MPKLASVKSLSSLLVSGIGASDWYPKASESIRQWCKGQRVDYVCDVLALVSPRKTVADSVRIAKHYLATGKLIDVTQSVRAQFAHYVDTGEIRGPKCKAFAQALKGDDSALVVDTWIMKALKAPITSTGRQWVLRGALRRFRKLSEVTGLSIASCQASVWCGIQGGQCAYLEMGN